MIPLRSKSCPSVHPGVARFWRDDRGVSAVEFAIVSGPFVFLMLFMLQLGVYYMTQASLDAGMVKTAEALRNGFTGTANPSPQPNATSLKAQIVSNSGGLIRNDSTLAVEIRPLDALSGSSVAITDGTNLYGSTTSVLVLRAQANVVAFTPGFSMLNQTMSSAIVRRQGR